MKRSHHALSTLLLLSALTLASILHAQAKPPASTVQTGPGSIHGQVTDPSGAVIPNASVSVTDAQGHTVSTGMSGPDGSYSITGVPAGNYIVFVTAPGFGSLSTKSFAVAAGANKLVNATLIIMVQQQNVQVNAGLPTVSVDPDANANSIVLKDKDLDALSDDPDELSNELTALAGPAAGPSGGQIYIDGFTGGELPPKSAIREIRVNQNPYGAQFDKLGFGRIEVFTKPGTDKFHGEFQAQGNARQLNTGNPFVPDSSKLPDYNSYQYEGTLSGPINKKASFFVSAQRRNIQDDSIVSAYRLQGEINGNFAAGNFGNTDDYTAQNFAVGFSDALNTPQTRTNITPRVDIQLTEKNSLSVRYQYERNVKNNQGVGQFSLTSQAYNSTASENQIQLSDTEVFGPRVISETHLRAVYGRSTQSPANGAPQVQVQGYQTFGGNGEQSINDHTDEYELSNLTELALNTHSISLGGRLRATREANAADSDFNGLFTFASRRCPAGSVCPFADSKTNNLSAGAAYAATLYGQGNGQSFQQLQAAGGGPSQLVLVTGNPKAEVNAVDGAFFYQDDWKVKPNLTFSYGLRWETQNNIRDHSDFAPRLALSYGFTHNGKPTKDVLRLGFGYFYDRFGVSQVLQAARVNGIVQQELVLQNPSCYYPNALPSLATITATCETGSNTTTTANNSSSSSGIYQIGPNLHAPVNIQSSIGLDHQLTKSTTLSVTYIHSHGIHHLNTINANPFGTPGYDAALGNVYQYFSEGVYNQEQLFFNFHTQISRSLSAFGFYGLGFANADVNGTSSNPSNSLNLKQDYGRAGFDVRNRLFLIGTYAAPHNIRVSPFVVAQSGQPFNITLSQDLNGDSFFNDRPYIAPAGAVASNIQQTAYGNFYTGAPPPGTNPKVVPIFNGNGPSLFTLNLRLGKTWGFGQRLNREGGGASGGPPAGGGPPPGGGSHGRGGRGGGSGGSGGSGGGPGGAFGNNGSTGRRYNLTLNAQALNLLNIINVAPPTGTIDSPNFGQSNALAGTIFSSGSAARRIFLQANFTF